MVTIITRLERYFGFQQPLVWRNIIGIGVLNLASLYTLFVLIPFKLKWITTITGVSYGILGGMSITIGAHRLWTHRTYKAKLPLRVLIMYFYMTTGMYSMVQWVRDHRTHHKFTDTDADPHNAKRGLLFSHCGWLMMKRHPDVKSKGKLIDLSDVLRDPVVRFQQKYFVPLLIFCNIIVPSFCCRVFFDEPWEYTIIGLILGRVGIMMHSTWAVNSVAHLYGYKPYNKNIMAVENKTAAFFTLGEAWHNFHHTFPWDYRIGEYGRSFQTGTHFIDFFANIGLAYDLKFASPEMIQRVLDKNGNLPINKEISEEEISQNMSADDKLRAKLRECYPIT